MFSNTGSLHPEIFEPCSPTCAVALRQKGPYKTGSAFLNELSELLYGRGGRTDLIPRLGYEAEEYRWNVGVSLSPISQPCARHRHASYTATTQDPYSLLLLRHHPRQPSPRGPSVSVPSPLRRLHLAPLLQGSPLCPTTLFEQPQTRFIGSGAPHTCQPHLAERYFRMRHQPVFSSAKDLRSTAWCRVYACFRELYREESRPRWSFREELVPGKTFRKRPSRFFMGFLDGYKMSVLFLENNTSSSATTASISRLQLSPVNRSLTTLVVQASRHHALHYR